jgi:hypothetical protein
MFDFKIECLDSKLNVWFKNWMFIIKMECLIIKSNVYY